MSAEPWFRFFPSDWLGGTAALSAAEKGVYVTLIALMYDEAGPIVRDDARLSRQCGLPKVSFVRALQCLIDLRKIEENGQCLFNSRAKNELTERENRIVNAREGAHVTNAKRANKSVDDLRSSERSTDPLALAPPYATRARVPQPQPQEIRDARASLVDAPPSASADLFPRQAKKLEKTGSDQKLLDEITDVWNRWASAHGSPQVKYLTGTRATHCRHRIADLSNGHGPIPAFEELLAKCEQSFFVKGAPDRPLQFDQLMTESFMVKMMEDGFKYQTQVRPQWRK